MSERLHYVVEEEWAGERLDRFLALQLDSGLTRTRAQALIRAGMVTVDGKAVRPSVAVAPGQVIDVRLPPPEDDELPQPEDIPLDVVYEDDDVLVINKPRGMVVHPAPGHTSGTLVNALLAYTGSLSQVAGPMRPGIVHRLDRDTTGLIIVAKNDEAHYHLANQLRTRDMERRYLALVHRVPPTREGIIDVPVGRHPTRRQQMAAVPTGGRSALTLFRVLEVYRDVPGYGDLALLDVKLQSGRTHQIRVHLSHIEHPIAGDPLYGRRRTVQGLGGQALHAYRLRFRHPRTDEPIVLFAPLPSDFGNFLTRIRGESFRLEDIPAFNDVEPPPVPDQG